MTSDAAGMLAPDGCGLGTQSAYIPIRIPTPMAFRMATQTRFPRPRRQSGVVVREGDTWLGLVAATTKGVGKLDRVRLRVRTASPMQGHSFRLVVQSYAAAAVAHNGTPHGTPLASLQRAVSPDELRTGLDVDVMHIGASSYSAGQLVVYAWVEPGTPDLDYDAALARPSSGALRGSAHPQHDLLRGLTAELLLKAA